MDKLLKDPRNKLLTKNQNPVNNDINKQKHRLGRLKSQENINQLNRLNIKSLYNKNTPINPKNILFKKSLRKLSKKSIIEMINKNNSSLNKKFNFLNSNTTKTTKRIFQHKGIYIEHGNDVGMPILTNTLYDDIKIRNIINLWNDLEVKESYRKYFFFIYKELGEEDRLNFYSNEVNELIHLKNDIKNLTYNIELRLGIIQKLSELNEQLNKENETGEVSKTIINEMLKKFEDLTIQTINIIQFMKKIKTVINVIPNLGKYDLDNIAQKFDFDKNYIIKMKFETNFLKEGLAKKFFDIKNDQSPFVVKAVDKNNIFLYENQNNKLIFLEEKTINDMIDCNYFIYKELIGYENEKVNKRIYRKISPIKKNISAYNFYTNITFFTSELIKRKEGRKNQLLLQLNQNKKETLDNLYNNSVMNMKNMKKKLSLDKNLNNSTRIIQKTDLLNHDISNINKNTKVFNLHERKKQVYKKNIDTNNNYINFHNNFKKEIINPIINNSEKILPMEKENLKINEKISAPNIVDIPKNNNIEESKDGKKD